MNKCYFGDCRDSLDKIKQEGITVQTCITSPPYYGLRSYLDDINPNKHLEVGLEESPEEYIQGLVEVFRKVRDVLADDGTLWVNIGDSYYNYRPGKSYPKQSIASNNQDLPENSPKRNRKLVGYKEKDLMGIPWMLAFALRADGWYLRQDIIWSKPNPMPESVRDRCTKSHEYIFLFSKNQDYYFDVDAISENSRRKRSVWEVQVKPYRGAHFATYPTELINPCILASSRVGDIVLDPFLGSGTTSSVAEKLNRNWIGCELNEDYRILQDERLGRLGLHNFLY
jgi:DNA modification methylase